MRRPVERRIARAGGVGNATISRANSICDNLFNRVLPFARPLRWCWPRMGNWRIHEHKSACDTPRDRYRWTLPAPRPYGLVRLGRRNGSVRPNRLFASPSPWKKIEDLNSRHSECESFFLGLKEKSLGSDLGWPVSDGAFLALAGFSGRLPSRDSDNNLFSLRGEPRRSRSATASWSTPR